jgi:hypothetical protein
MDFTDAVTRVDFLAGTNLLGVVTNGANAGWLGKGSYEQEFDCITWSNAPTGAYILDAVATDLAGNSATSAPVDISVVTNFPPRVRIIEPADGAVILGPTNLTLAASAFDRDGSVTSVEFFNGTHELGWVTNESSVWVATEHKVFEVHPSDYYLTWSNVPAGSYTLTAEATDNGGVTSLSAPAEITVVTDLPPVVNLVAPENGYKAYAPITITLTASASDSGGKVAELQFFSGTQLLGVVTNGIAVSHGRQVVDTFYSLTWSNVPAGAYTLDAVAADKFGISSTSAPVHITVLTPPPPLAEIIYPASGAEFVAPASIPITATTKYFTNPIANVHFLSGASVLGVVSNYWSPTFYWKNVTNGTYSLSVLATDTHGITATSAPVDITVVTNTPKRWH